MQIFPAAYKKVYLYLPMESMEMIQRMSLFNEYWRDLSPKISGNDAESVKDRPKIGRIP